MYKSIFIIFTIFAVSHAVIAADTQNCKTLKKTEQQSVDKILKETHGYGCCTDTVASCLKSHPSCKTLNYIKENICFRVKKGESESKILKRVALRKKSLESSQIKAVIDLKKSKAAGNPQAPVTLVVYACSRCPFCARLVPELYKAVTDGNLKNRVKLYFKPFPLKSHKYSKEGGLAMIAALKMGKFWPYILKLYGEFNDFSVDKLASFAKQTALDPDRFTKIMKDPKTRKDLVDSKKEGLVNRVTATPQLFINGKKYVNFLDINEITSALNEEYDSIKAQ